MKNDGPNGAKLGDHTHGAAPVVVAGSERLPPLRDLFTLVGADPGPANMFR